MGVLVRNMKFLVSLVFISFASAAKNSQEVTGHKSLEEKSLKKGRKWKKSRKFTLRRFRTRRFPPVSRRPVGPVRSRNPSWYRSRNRYLGSGCSRNRRSKNRRSRNRLLYAPLGCSRNLLCC